MNPYYLSIVDKKLDLAQRLYTGNLGGTYSDALLIVLGVLSATSSILWKGERIDKKRFVELLIKHNTTNHKFSNISTFIMFQKNHKFLSEDQQCVIFEKCNSWRINTRIYTGDEIDFMESVIIEKWPDINLKELRKYSYASLFYEEIRSSLIHEYSVSNYASPQPMFPIDSFVSYVNCVKEPNQLIYFHFDKLLEITRSIATNVASLEKTPMAHPEKWWLDGGNTKV